MNYIVGLGNPGKEYEKTRHNTGRIILDLIRNQNNFPDWKFDKRINAFISKGKIENKLITFILPETFMNNSGKTLKALDIGKQTQNILVIYDDLDLAWGNAKISFNKSAGGHRGVESIIKALKSQKFYRIRVGISPKTPTGKIKKPKGEEAVNKLIMKSFKDEEMKELKKLYKSINETLSMFLLDGYEKSASFLN